MSIIIVDDEAAVRSCLHDLLKATGHDVVSVATCDEALCVLKDQACDVALVDYNMGPPDGIETLRRIRAEHPACAGILMTGSLSDPELEKAAERGEIAQVLVKPFLGEALPCAIEEGRARDTAAHPSRRGRPRRVLKVRTYKHSTDLGLARAATICHALRPGKCDVIRDALRWQAPLGVSVHLPLQGGRIRSEFCSVGI